MLITSGQISVNLTNFSEAIEMFLVVSLKQQAGRERGKKKMTKPFSCITDLYWIKLLTESQH